MKYCLVLVQWMVLATAMAAPAGAPKAAAPPGNRFLFVLETSATMGRLEHGGRQAIFDLIYSGVDGRMRKGDTYGIWTFNDNVYAGFYPMQIWDGRKNLEHASAAGRFLKTQKYEKDGSLTNLLKQVQAVLRVAKDLNVFIVTDGKTLVGGTPFDEQINTAYRDNAVQLRETKKPLVTTFTARNGQFTSAYVSVAGEEIVLADLPPQTNSVSDLELATAELTASASNATARASQAAKPTGKIVSVADVETQAQRPKPIVITNSAAIGEGIELARLRGGIIMTNSTPKPPNTNAVEDPSVMLTLAPLPPTTPGKPVVTNPVAVAVAKPALVITNAAPAPGPEPLPSIVPAQMKVSARAPSETMAEVARTGATAMSSSFGNLMMILGGAFVGASVAGGLIFLRRARSPKQPSFISQGMDKR